MSINEKSSLENLIIGFINQKKEGENWDFKQEWHDNIQDLIKDIICFSNTVHDENCYLIFGVSDDFKIVGMKNKRKKQADILDTLSSLSFAGDVVPQIELKTISINNCELDVLIVFDEQKTPIYLEKSYGEMREGCIYLRKGDKNTPNKRNANILDIEKLWKKRFGLTKPNLEIIFDRMSNKSNWSETDSGFYDIYNPAFNIKLDYSEDDLRTKPMFYAYAMFCHEVSYHELIIRNNDTILFTSQIVFLENGTLRVPCPNWGILKLDLTAEKFYKYYIKGDKNYKVLSFLCDNQTYEEIIAYNKFAEVIVFYASEEEKIAFESFIKLNYNLIDEKIKSTDKYDYIRAQDEQETEKYKNQLKLGYSLNCVLKQWRKEL